MSFDFKLANGDLVLKNGTVQIVRNKDKLIQDILKMMFTAVGENKTHPWYGTPLLNKVLGTAHNLDLLDVEVKRAIQYGLNNLKTLQTLQQQDNQFVTPQEILAKIVNIDIQFDPLDKRRLVVTIQITARSNEIITENFVVAI